jgi:hypothetical protein
VKVDGDGEGDAIYDETAEGDDDVDDLRVAAEFAAAAAAALAAVEGTSLSQDEPDIGAGAAAAGPASESILAPDADADDDDSNDSDADGKIGADSSSSSSSDDSSDDDDGAAAAADTTAPRVGGVTRTKRRAAHDGDDEDGDDDDDELGLPTHADIDAMMEAVSLGKLESKTKNEKFPEEVEFTPNLPVDPLPADAEMERVGEVRTRHLCLRARKYSLTRSHCTHSTRTHTRSPA